MKLKDETGPGQRRGDRDDAGKPLICSLYLHDGIYFDAKKAANQGLDWQTYCTTSHWRETI
jgi:hypothetical protein